MKCEICLELLEEYFDGELAERESSDVAAHLMACVSCARESAVLTAEHEIFSRYDRELEIAPVMWEQIAERTVAPVVTKASRNGFGEWFVGLFSVPAFRFSAATAALILIAVLVGAIYMGTKKPAEQMRAEKKETAPQVRETPNESIDEHNAPEQSVGNLPGVSAQNDKPKVRRAVGKRTVIDQSDVVSADFGSQDPEDQDTAKHIEQTQNLLRSIRNVELNDSDQDIDVSYDKAVSRRLLNENIVLRRDAEMKAKFPTKALLSDLEPFLIDIANLPDQARPEDVRAIKERVQKTEIVAALIGYK